MDGQTLEQIRSMLMARWTRIGQASSPVFPGTEDELASSAELIDLAQALEQVGRDTPLKEAERREMLAIQRALAKMATGQFGVCEDCAEDIAPKRLMVLPEARLCAHCQTFEERQNAKTPRLKAAGE